MNNNIIIPIEANLGNAPLDLGVFFSNLVGVALILAAIAAFVYLVMGGILWITAGGDKGKIEEARNRITNAIIGLVIVACSWAIFVIIDHFLGLNVANQTSSSYGDPGSGGGSGGGSGQQGVCISTSRCDDGPVGSSFYCQNELYKAKSFGSCGTNMVYCDCVAL